MLRQKKAKTEVVFDKAFSFKSSFKGLFIANKCFISSIMTDWSGFDQVQVPKFKVLAFIEGKTTDMH